ncbi:MAG: bifunctional methylenetetrahydrofolate dehydrogenase/methenyltetrahydrofolate cyclohydrolase FolD [Candidatus Aminicenantaceae bacterium]
MGIWMEGKTLANDIKQEIEKEVSDYREQGSESPYLIGIQVGENKASQIYLKSKKRNCEKIGIKSDVLNFPADIKPDHLKKEISRLNEKDDVDGILVQLPLPPAFNQNDVIMSLSPEKDVDGFHPINLGNLLLNQEGFKPCTPLGIIELLKSNKIGIEGKRVVIIGRSLIVGKPLAVMMTNENGTVTICHSRTKNLSEVASDADILVAAIGRTAFVNSEFVKEGATVVDVGINYLSDKAKMEQLFGKDEKREKKLSKKGYTLVGDVHPDVIKKAEFLTPVPGGVGPLTIAMLMKNTLEAFKKRRGDKA